MTQAKGYVDRAYLRCAEQLLRSVKEQSYARMRVEPGHKVLDVGCGPGTDTLPLAERVGAAGLVLGIDSDSAMLIAADRRARQARLSTWVSHQRGSAMSLPVRSEYFDASRCERLFQHLPDPERALTEMVRVTRRDGWIVVLDTDWGTLSMHSKEVEIERRLQRLHAERLLYNGYAGRQLYHLFRRQRLADVQINLYPVYLVELAQVRELTALDETEREALNLGLLSATELECWHASLAEVEAEGGFFCSATLVMVSGRKP
ncbi:MAG: methyltransferase domain-containing protein [Gammaproteobacteria bacterium]